jgi:hypothetical protein
VRALMHANQSATLRTRYRKQHHVLHLRPLAIERTDGTPAGFYVATFRDTSLERAILARVFMTSLGGPILLPIVGIGLTLLLISLSAQHANRRWSAWLWPHGGLTPVHRRLSCILAGVLAAGAALCAAGRGDAAVLLVPLGAIVSAAAVYARYLQNPAPRRPLAAHGWHTAMLMLLVICLVVVPAAVLFRTAVHHAFGTFIGAEADWMREQTHDLQMAIRAEARAAGFASAVGERIVDQRLMYLTGAPEPFTRAQPAGTGDAQGLLGATVHVLGDLLPAEDDVLTRPRFHAAELTYAPPGTVPGPWPMTGIALAAGIVTLAGLVLWIRWSTTRILYAQLMGAAGATPAGDFSEHWAACTDDERCVLLQVARERVANPHQPVVVALLRRGLLTLDPDLRPASPAFEAFILEQEPGLADTLHAWERVNTSHSWRYMRLVLLATVGVASFFLVATQPGLQSGLLGIASGVTGVLTAGVKLREVVAEWMVTRKTTA